MLICEKKNIIYYVKKRREYLNLGCVRAVYDSDKNSRFSMRYSAKWPNKGLHSLLHGIGWTTQIILGKKRSCQPSMLTISLPCPLSAYLAPSRQTLLNYQHSMLTISLRRARCSLSAYLPPSWCTLLAISLTCSLSSNLAHY
jgi:hypothetical protein